MSNYSFSTTTAGPLSDARERVTTALAAEGFGVLTEIDVAATMKAKLDVDVEPYVILGACNPPLAHQALTTEPSVGVLLPCNVVLRATGDQITVEFMDPTAVLTLVDREGIESLAAEVRGRLERVRDAVAG
ncbi:MAG: DUF302 domain-containing protein [Acidimicrobiia bacterium]|nr:DUF302 domain-containing protein [Acidimicrobiia bacterium]